MPSCISRIPMTSLTRLILWLAKTFLLMLSVSMSLFMAAEIQTLYIFSASTVRPTQTFSLFIRTSSFVLTWRPSSYISTSFLTRIANILMSFTSTVFRKPIRPFLSMITTRNTLVSCSILLWHTRPQGLWLLRLLWLLWLLWLLRLLWLFRSFWMTFTLGLKLVQITWPILTLPPTSIMRSSIYIFLFSIFS